MFINGSIQEYFPTCLFFHLDPALQKDPCKSSTTQLQLVKVQLYIKTSSSVLFLLVLKWRDFVKKVKRKREETVRKVNPTSTKPSSRY